jgi:hypothetical protein
MARAETTYNTVKMDDGRTVDFPGKRRLLKSSEITADGQLQTRLDFVNGETRLFTIPAELLQQFALHGAEQKLGDEVSGLDDIDDAILAVDELMERLAAGDWSQRREASGIAGSSVLARALVELTGKSPATIKEELKALPQADKVALRGHPKLQPIIARLEAAKRAKGPQVDTDAVLAKLGVGVDGPAAETAAE